MNIFEEALLADDSAITYEGMVCEIQELIAKLNLVRCILEHTGFMADELWIQLIELPYILNDIRNNILDEKTKEMFADENKMPSSTGHKRPYR